MTTTAAPGVVTRYAIVRNARDRQHVAAYMPVNYATLAERVERTERFSAVAPSGVQLDERLVVVIGGQDAAGWTLDGYVIPRLASGLMRAEEIDLSHPIMRTIEATS